MNGHWIGSKSEHTNSFQRLAVAEVVVYGWILGEI
jgi:hypothetical protein